MQPTDTFLLSTFSSLAFQSRALVLTDSVNGNPVLSVQTQYQLEEENCTLKNISEALATLNKWIHQQFVTNTAIIPQIQKFSYSYGAACTVQICRSLDNMCILPDQLQVENCAGAAEQYP